MVTRIEAGQSPSAYESGDKHVYFTYDYMSRRIRKRVETYNGSSWPETSDELFVYDGWNIVMVINANASDVNATAAITRKYTWGLDLSGTIHGAGGIGGLLAGVVPMVGGDPGETATLWYFYDANGNVGQVLDATSLQTIGTAAKYEYDPYGNLIASSGAYATANPFRFSTKWFDPETGLGYWGYRYYSPRLGRWLSRDPSGERGGLNLQLFALNEPVGTVDVLGLAKFVLAEASQANAWSNGRGYLRWEVGEELTVDTATCCVECKAKWKISGGLGIAYGKGFKYTVSEFTVSAGFLVQGSLFDINTEAEAVLLRACPPWTQSSMSFDGVIAEAFAGGHVEGKLYGQVSGPWSIPVKLSVGGAVFAKAGLTLGVGATVSITHSGSELFSGFKADGTVWLNAYSDLVINGNFGLALSIWGYEIWNLPYPVDVVESDPFGLVKYPILTF